MDARLLLRSRMPIDPPTLLARGGLAEMVTEALDRPWADRGRLMICVDRDSEAYDWADICEMAGKSDFPVLI